MSSRFLRPSLANTVITSTRYRPISSPSRWFGNLLGRSDSPPRSSGFELLNTIEKVEEENWKWYSVDTYYPVRIGETFRSQYQVLGKLGYGAHSTVWLGRDLKYDPASLFLPLALAIAETGSTVHTSMLH